MNRRRFIALGLGTGASIGLVPKLLSKQMSRVEEKSIALGSEISIVAYHEHRETAQRAIRAAFKALDELEDLLSLYRPHSQICELNRERVLKQPHAHTLTVIRSALEWASLTEGAFDPTVQPLWSIHAADGSPDPLALENARRLVNWQTVKVTPNEIRLAPGQQITLNGIAPGFAADLVREVFVAHGIKHALLNTGELCALGPNPEGVPWQIGIQHPRVREAYAALAAVENRFLATSGDYETRFSEDFTSHHIFDPATGRSPSELSSVTVLAPAGMDADALSTAIFVLGATRGLEQAARRKNVDVLLIAKRRSRSIHTKLSESRVKYFLFAFLFLATPLLTTAEKSKAEVQTLIKQIGSTPPEWFKETPLKYPKTIDLSWSPDYKGPWDPSLNVGQFIWTSINENESRWKEGIRFLHHVLTVNQKNPAIVKQTMEALGQMYHNLHQDWARAAFWWQKAGETDKIDLAHCYYKLGSKAMAVEILNKWPSDYTRHCSVARLWSEIGESDKALSIALQTARNTPDVGFLAAGDICRTAGRTSEALTYYQKALAATEGGRDLKQTKHRAQASIDAIKLAELLDIKRVPDGSYRDSSIGYNGPVQVEVHVAKGRIADVKVVKHEEKQYYSSITDTCQQMILKQGAKGVDATSGATITSEAILNAGLKAMSKAQR